ncbi:twin-arginine translocation signal domain-containing protein [Aestuariivirga sp.]|uniref:twin-arginine translocation signal domain-containing protein n=1 Tax=Aestuariivirga sp. TaxID=2650926 RepID=UPI0039E2C99D
MNISRRDFVAGCGALTVASVPAHADEPEISEFVTRVESCGMTIFATTLEGVPALHLHIDLTVESPDLEVDRDEVFEQLAAWKKLSDWQKRRQRIIHYLVTTGRSYGVTV